MDFPRRRQLFVCQSCRQPLPRAGSSEWGILAVLTRVSITRSLVSCSTQETGSMACPCSMLRGRGHCRWHLGTMLPIPLVTSQQRQEVCELVALGLKRALFS